MWNAVRAFFEEGGKRLLCRARLHADSAASATVSTADTDEGRRSPPDRSISPCPRRFPGSCAAIARVTFTSRSARTGCAQRGRHVSLKGTARATSSGSARRSNGYRLLLWDELNRAGS
jgi:hypothetical protein